MNLSAIRRRDDGVLPHDLAVEKRLAQRDRMPSQDAIPINALPGHTIEPLRDVQALDAELSFAARNRFKLHAPILKEIRRPVITRALHMKIDFNTHQPWLVER